MKVILLSWSPQRKSSCFLSALNKSHPAFVELATKVILLSESFQRKSACFRGAKISLLLENFWRAFGEPAFNKLSESFWRVFGELLESFWRAFKELVENYWRACFKIMFVERSEILLSESFCWVFKELSESSQRAFEEPACNFFQKRSLRKLRGISLRSPKASQPLPPWLLLLLLFSFFEALLWSFLAFSPSFVNMKFSLRGRSNRRRRGLKLPQWNYNRGQCICYRSVYYRWQLR